MVQVYICSHERHAECQHGDEQQCTRHRFDRAEWISCLSEWHSECTVVSRQRRDTASKLALAIMRYDTAIGVARVMSMKGARGKQMTTERSLVQSEKQVARARFWKRGRSTLTAETNRTHTCPSFCSMTAFRSTKCRSYASKEIAWERFFIFFLAFLLPSFFIPLPPCRSSSFPSGAFHCWLS